MKKMRLRCGIFIPLLLVSFVALPSLADRAYISREEMISGADLIAVIQIDKVEKVVSEKNGRPAGQKANAAVLSVIKGQTLRSVDISVNEFDGCANVARLVPGRFLAFLSSYRGRWGPVNDDLGLIPVVNNQLVWRGKNPSKLASVINELKGKNGTWIVGGNPACSKARKGN